MASVTLLALLLPGRGLDPLWRVNPRAHAVFQSMGLWALVLMTPVAGACALAAIGLWIRARWGHRLAVAILVVNLIGDTTNALVLGDRRTLIGLPIGGLLVGYLLSRRVRDSFKTDADGDHASYGIDGRPRRASNVARTPAGGAARKVRNVSTKARHREFRVGFFFDPHPLRPRPRGRPARPVGRPVVALSRG